MARQTRQEWAEAVRKIAAYAAAVGMGVLAGYLILWAGW